MDRKVLVVIDMQNDFVDGALGTKEAVSIVPFVVDKVKELISDGYEVIFTKDTHDEEYLSTQEGNKLPVKHCIKPSHGWELIKELQDIQNQYNLKVIEKPGFGSVELAEYLKAKDRQNPIKEVAFLGLCTDICVVCNALLIKAALPESLLKVYSDCCAGVSPDAHKAALQTMKSCQVEII